MGVEAKTLRRITWYVLGSAVVLTVVAFVAGGALRGVGAAVGGGVAVANWHGMRWLGERILRASDSGRMVWSTLLAVKMAATLGVIWMILATGWVDPLGFAIGVSAFVVGILGGAFHLAASGSAGPATEEN